MVNDKTAKYKKRPTENQQVFLIGYYMLLLNVF